MRSFAMTGKMVSCALGTSLLLGACEAPLGPVGVTEQGDATYSYLFSMDTMVIQNTRSRVTDTDFAAVAVGVDGHDVGRVARYVGDYNNGTYPVNLSFGPFTVGPSSPVSIAYSIFNKGQTGEDFASFVGSVSAIAAFAAGTYLWFTVPEGRVLFTLVFSAFIGFLDFLFANCDGPVVVGKLDVDGPTLASWTRYAGTHTEWRDFPGVDSPAGCGSNSRYRAAWTITQIGWAPVCGDGMCSPGETCSSCPQDCGTCPVCGNGICELGETCENCPQDCGPCHRYCTPPSWDCCGDGSVCCPPSGACP